MNEYIVTERLTSLYTARFGVPPDSVAALPQDGSDRNLYRLAGPDAPSVIGVYGPERDENRAFLSYSLSLRSAGFPVPEIYASDLDAGIYLEEDLGDTTLHGALRAAGGFTGRIVAAYRQVVALLPRLQVEGGRAVDYSAAHPRAEYDRTAMMWDLNYFKYHFLKLARAPFNESRLEVDFTHLCDFLLQSDRSHFMHRDFQSRNIMLRAGDQPWIIDYQGGRRGALQYDLVKLLYEPGANMPQPLRDELLGDYLLALGKYTEVDAGEFTGPLRGFLLLRLLQGLGAYGYRGLFEGRPRFAANIPPAIAITRQVMHDGVSVELPELRSVLEKLTMADKNE